ncbi:MAG: NupC/NupG family nucleoside CNT transporter [Xanthomonadales bacterium]|nr:NupC/NupG family nucleoside CNT transporter [Xanthomonadales bacterium]
MLGNIGFGVLGLAALLGLAWLFSCNRRQVDWKLVGTGVALQIAFALLVLVVPQGRAVFDALGHGFVLVLGFTREGAGFIFGKLLDIESFGFIFAFQVLPTIIFFSALMGVLYHLGVMQKIVQVMARGITKVMPVSGAESLSVCANVFVGQTEAPLVVRPYIAGMTKSELLALMIGGMATIAGGVMAAYIGMLGGSDPELQQFYAKHLLSASIMAAPATLVIAKILYPEVEEPATRGTVKVHVEVNTANVIDAAATGAGDGLRLALNVGAMLLAFIALIALANAPLAWLGGIEWFGSGFHINDLIGQVYGQPSVLSIQSLLGILLAPIAAVIGVPWQDALQVGSLIGQKVVLNEFVAYSELVRVQGELTDKGRLIATYALCGFANFSSIAIQIGGIGGLAPERRADLARFGLRAVLGGTLATFMTATIAGVLGGL